MCTIIKKCENFFVFTHYIRFSPTPSDFFAYAENKPTVNRVKKLKKYNILKKPLDNNTIYGIIVT